MIMKGCVQWNSVYGREDFISSEDRTQSARSAGQRLTHWATKLLKEFQFLMSLKIWRSMADTVCHAPLPMTQLIYYGSNYDV